MKTLTRADFLNWAEPMGLNLDERYPNAAVLAFRTTSDHDRFWDVPPEPERRPSFIVSLLELMGDWQFCYVWRHRGAWPQLAVSSQINEAVERRILKGLGLPLGTSDVVEIPREELDTLVALMFTTTVFGWSSGRTFAWFRTMPGTCCKQIIITRLGLFFEARRTSTIWLAAWRKKDFLSLKAFRMPRSNSHLG